MDVACVVSSLSFQLGIYNVSCKKLKYTKIDRNKRNGIIIQKLSLVRIDRFCPSISLNYFIIFSRETTVSVFIVLQLKTLCLLCTKKFHCSNAKAFYDPKYHSIRFQNYSRIFRYCYCYFELVRNSGLESA